MGTHFLSATSGNGNDGATWGNTSPGVAGVDYPNPAGGDTCFAKAGHTVTFTVDTILGASLARTSATLQGTLDAITNSTTVAGTSTLFQSEVKEGDILVPSGDTDRVQVIAIASDTSLTVDKAATWSGGISYAVHQCALGMVGTVIVNAGVTLTLKGHFSGSTGTFTLNGNLSIDCSAAPAPSTDFYTFWVGANVALNIGPSSGDSSIVTSILTGGAAPADMTMTTGGSLSNNPGDIVIQNITWSNWGTASRDLVSNLRQGVAGRSFSILPTAQFDNCGRIHYTSLLTSAHFTIDGVSFINCLAGSAFRLTAGTGTATGTRLLRNIFSEATFDFTGTSYANWTIQDVVVRAWSGWSVSSTGDVTLYERVVGFWGNPGGSIMLNPVGGIMDNILIIPMPHKLVTAVINPHCISTGTYRNVTTHRVTRLIAQVLGDSSEGELFLQTGTTNHGVVVDHSLMLKNRAGQGSLAFTTGGGVTVPGGEHAMELKHNTAYVAGTQRCFAGNGGQTAEGGIGHTGLFSSVHDNLVVGDGILNTWLVKDLAGSAVDATIGSVAATTVTFPTRAGDSSSANAGALYTLRVITQVGGSDPPGTEYLVTATSGSGGNLTYTIGTHGIGVGDVVRTYIKNIVAGGVDNIHHNAIYQLDATQTAYDETYDNGQANVEGFSITKLTGTIPGVAQSHITGEPPNFVDTARGFPQYAQSILGTGGADWVTSTAYTVGDKVYHAISGKWNSQKIWYTCIANHTSSASDEPDTGANWSGFWQYTTFYEMSFLWNSAVFNSMYSIATIMDWIRDGFRPTNGALESASDIAGLSNGWRGALEGVLTPIITSSLTASGTAGEAFSYQITADNTPTSFNATGLPAGLSINTSTGEITGTPSSGGVTEVTISATNAAGTDEETLVITIAGGEEIRIWIGSQGSFFSHSSGD